MNIKFNQIIFDIEIVVKNTYFCTPAEKEGQPNMDDDWDSLSVRMRRQRRLRHNGKKWNHFSLCYSMLDVTIKLLL